MAKSMNLLKSTAVTLSAVGALTACGGQSVEGQPNAVPSASRTTEIPTHTTTPNMPPETQSPLRPTEFPVEDKVCTRMPKLDDSRRGPQGATIYSFAAGTTCEMSVRDDPDPASPEIGKMNKDTLFTMTCYQGIGDVMLHNSAILVQFNIYDMSGSKESRTGYVIDMDDAWSDPSRKSADSTLLDCEQGGRWDPDHALPPLVVTGTK